MHRKYWKRQKSRSPSLQQLLLVSAGALFLLWVFFVATLGRGDKWAGETAAPGSVSVVSKGSLRHEKRIKDLERCEWIRDKLRRNDSIGPPLPQSGVARKGVTFWLKSPELHTRDDESGDEIMILKYNVYNPTQHTEKFENTIKVLTEYPEEKIFPKLYGYCRDIDGFHYVAVEFIKFDVNNLPRPESLESCVRRAEEVVGLFARLDEKYHMLLADIKPGQWMARNDMSMVLQDVDDIVPHRSKVIYEDQADWIRGTLESRLPNETRRSIHRAWNMYMFPRSELTSRYAVISTEMILNNLGFQWDKDCLMTPEFKSCYRKLIRWTQTLEDDWPSPLQIQRALRECLEGGHFEKTKRPLVPWREVKPLPSKEYVPVSACKRPYDRVEQANEFTRCEDSCCRAKGSQKCYYTVDNSFCS